MTLGMETIQENRREHLEERLEIWDFAGDRSRSSDSKQKGLED